jgi:hypothetical protein
MYESIVGHDNITDQVKLYIDLVSDLMFNYHMVHSLNLQSRGNGSSYAYIYAHRPTFKIRSTFRDQLKLLPDVIGHFAELGKSCDDGMPSPWRISMVFRLCLWCTIGSQLFSNSSQCQSELLQLHNSRRKLQSTNHSVLGEFHQDWVRHFSCRIVLTRHFF